MAKRPALIQQSDATRLFKAARAAGYARARLITHPDGRVEIIGEDGPEAVQPAVEVSPFEKWKAGNAR
ncbi:transcription factor iiib subunit [Xanthobacter versatilis]|uniref:transcription factor iiib subunit n=1 Tax=Xanthobacter autotrophicus (strain ATCC BAA-1158 / Py2) TaxID=78245 RepID=UPI00372C1A8D